MAHVAFLQSQRVKTLPESYKKLDDATAIARIVQVRQRLGEKVYILGHNYQRDEVIRFADAQGDSLKLSQIASKQNNADYIVFCGVHFMAETADILNEGRKIVTLPNLSAGCPMADMAPLDLVLKVWKELLDRTSNIFTPVAYINCYASLKAFCGQYDGVICTSSNAEKIIQWALQQKAKVFLLPDQNLGYNIARKLGLKKQETVVWNPFLKGGGLSDQELHTSKIVLWKGCCPVHEKFQVEHVKKWREKDHDLMILVHPECVPEVVEQADLVGSTQFIIDTIRRAPSGSKWVIGTEVHLVARLAKENPDKEINLLSPPTCMCSMMDRTSPQDLLWNLECLSQGDFTHWIKVNDDVRQYAKKALELMLNLS